MWAARVRHRVEAPQVIARGRVDAGCLRELRSLQRRRVNPDRVDPFAVSGFGSRGQLGAQYRHRIDAHSAAQRRK